MKIPLAEIMKWLPVKRHMSQTDSESATNNKSLNSSKDEEGPKHSWSKEKRETNSIFRPSDVSFSSEVIAFKNVDYNGEKFKIHLNKNEERL